MPAEAKVRYLVFDVESAADGKLVAEIRYPHQKLDPSAAISQYRQQRFEETGSEFIPHTFQYPICIVVAKIDADFRLIDVVALDEPQFRPHVMTEYFWRGWECYGRPTLVTFNGRSFDIPLLELAAFRYGISIPTWFDSEGKSWNQPRNRYNIQSHLDLQELLSNFGAVRFNGGLNLTASLLGKPGKMDIDGNMVQQLFDEGKRSEISQYCRCDVLDTYFVFLRSLVLTGAMVRDQEEQLVAEAKSWLLDRADDVPAFATYLDHWEDWPNPWNAAPPESSDAPADDLTSSRAG